MHRSGPLRLADALRIAGWTAFGLLLLAPFALGSRYWYYLATFVVLQAALATSLNFIIGYAGQFALAHAAFYGFGAYSSALLVSGANLSFWAAIPVSLGAAALLALAIGYPSLRYTGGVHFALITFAFGELARLVAANWYDVTGGPMGLRVMSAPEPVLGIDLAGVDGLYGLAVAVLLVCLATVAALMRTRFGRALVAIREDEVLASFLGIAVVRYKVAAFVLSAVLAALAGTVYGPFMTFISPDLLSGQEAISLVGALVVGGLGTLAGPIVGVLVFVALPELLHIGRLYRLVLLGGVIIACVILMPHGIVGLVDRRRGRLRRSSRTPEGRTDLGAARSAAAPGAAPP